MIETEEPPLRWKRRIAKIGNTISLYFLALIKFILRLLTSIVRGMYTAYMWFRKLNWKFKLLLILLFASLISGSIVLAQKQSEVNKLKQERQHIEQEKIEMEQKLKQENQELQDQIEQKDEEIKKLTLLRQQRKNIASTATRTPFNGVLQGKVSHYSRAGCLGCSPNLTMANGEPLDDARLTIAVPPGTIPMNTQVKVTNTTNGLTTIATVTDTGGFASLGRIADLTPAMASALQTKTDISNVLIEPL